MKYYKFLDEGNTGPYSNFDFTPYLPKGDKPGKWLPAVDALEMCDSGYHVCDADHLLERDAAWAAAWAAARDARDAKNKHLAEMLGID